MSFEGRLGIVEQRALEEVLEDVMNWKNRNLRSITTAFYDLPLPVEDFGEFWQSIEHPRSLNMIRQTLSEGGYSASVQVFADLKLVFLNAIKWLARGTETLRDAQKMETDLEDIWRRQVPPLPSLEAMSVISAYDDEPSVSRKRQSSKWTPKQAAEADRFGNETEGLMAGLLEAYRSGLQSTYEPTASRTTSLAAPSRQSSVPAEHIPGHLTPYQPPGSPGSALLQSTADALDMLPASSVLQKARPSSSLTVKLHSKRTQSATPEPEPVAALQVDPNLSQAAPPTKKTKTSHIQHEQQKTNVADTISIQVQGQTLTTGSSH